MYPREELTYAENLLFMMFAVTSHPYVVDKFAARCLEARACVCGLRRRILQAGTCA